MLDNTIRIPDASMLRYYIELRTLSFKQGIYKPSQSHVLYTPCNLLFSSTQSRITIPKAIYMATSEQEINEFSGTSDSCHCHQNEAQKGREKAESHMGKAIAHRAVYGSSHRRARSTRLRNNNVKTLPSRLSKVSIADEPEN